MLLADVPTKFVKPWADDAGGSYIRTIPTASQISVHDGWASLTDGFPPLNATPVASGGVPPFIQDFNGILYQSTAWLQWAQAGGVVKYDATFQAAVGGYPNGAVVASVTTAGRYWRSTADSNVTNPDAAGAGWVDFFAPVYASPTFSGTVTNGGSLVQTGGAAFNGGAAFAGGAALTFGAFWSVAAADGTLRGGSFGGSTVDPANSLLSVVNNAGTAAQFQSTLAAANATAIYARTNRTDGYYLQFDYSGAVLGSINTINGSTIQVNGTSDARHKDVRDLYDPGDLFDRINIYNFRWKTGKKRLAIGPVAQELHQAAPMLVTPGDDNPDTMPGDDGHVPWTTLVDTPTAMIMAELKALRARVATLEAAAR